MIPLHPRMLRQIRTFRKNPHHPAQIAQALHEVCTRTRGAPRCIDDRVCTDKHEHWRNTAVYTEAMHIGADGLDIRVRQDLNRM